MSRILSIIQSLNIPEHAKRLLNHLAAISTRLVESIIGFLRRHPGCEVMALSLAVAYLLQNLPIIGILLGGAIIFMGAAVALLQELRSIFNFQP